MRALPDGLDAIPPILRQMNQQRSEGALLLSAYVIRVTLGTETARTLINRELRDATDELHRQNLTRVLDVIGLVLAALGRTNQSRD